MSEQAGTHSVPLGGALPGAEASDYRTDLSSPRSAAAPFEPIDQDERPSRGWRPWAIVGVAIAIPAILATALVLTLGGGDDPVVPVAPPATTTVTSSTAVAAPTVTAETALSPSARTSTAAVTATPEQSVAAAAATGAAASETPNTTASQAAVADLPTAQERLAAWPEIIEVTVLDGDSTWNLALQYQTTVEAIAAVNLLGDPTALSIGQTLRIPVGFAESLEPVALTTETVTVADNSGAVIATAGVPPADTPLFEWPNVVAWTIEPGDSLSTLATTFDTSVEAIMVLNAITNPNLLIAGETISIPVGFSAAVAAPVAVTTTTTVATEIETITPVATEIETTTTTVAAETVTISTEATLPPADDELQPDSTAPTTAPADEMAPDEEEGYLEE